MNKTHKERKNTAANVKLLMRLEGAFRRHMGYAARNVPGATRAALRTGERIEAIWPGALKTLTEAP